MARLGVTYPDIAKAAATLRAEGIEPTVDRVREQLGTGSRSTIAPHLKRWRNERIDADALELPVDLVEAMKALSARVRDAADEKLEKLREEFDANSEELQNRLSAEAARSAALDAENNALKTDIEAERNRNGALTRDLEKLRLQLARTEVERDEAGTQVSKMKAQLTEIKSELQSVRKQSEHFQQAMAEDRRQERAEQLMQIQQYQGQTKALLDQLAATEHRYSELHQSWESLRRELDERTEANLALNDRYNRLKADMESMMLRTREVIHEKDQLQARHDTTSRQAAQVAAALATSLDTCKQLAFSLEKAEERLAQAENAKKQLMNTHKELMQQISAQEVELSRLQKAQTTTGLHPPRPATDS